jgi:hypothetical protein
VSKDEAQHLDFPERMPVVVEAALAGLAAARDLLAVGLSTLGQTVVTLVRGISKPKPRATKALVLSR